MCDIRTKKEIQKVRPINQIIRIKHVSMMENQSQDNETTGEVPKSSKAFVVSKQGILGVLTWCLAHRKSMQQYSYFSIIFIKCPGNHLEIR